MIVHPVPDEASAKKIAAGKEKANWVAASGWYTQGGIQADGGQLSVVDADGAVHPVPVPPNGTLVRSTRIEAMQGGATREYFDMFVADENQHIVAMLPSYDLGKAEGLDGLAAAVGLHFREVRTSPASKNWPYGGYSETDGMLKLEKAYESAHKHRRLGGLFHHGDGSDS